VQEQFAVQVVSTEGRPSVLATDQPYDVALLDLNHGDAAGLELLQNIRAKNPDLPVLIVTNASLVEERVRGLDAGADDYIAKPFAFAEPAARIRAVLRRNNRSAHAVLTVEDLTVDRVAHTVQRAGRAIDLSPKEFALLEFLMRHAGEPVTRTAIVEQVWKLNFDTMTNVVDVYINYLRGKVDAGQRSVADPDGSWRGLPDRRRCAGGSLGHRRSTVVCLRDRCAHRANRLKGLRSRF
jgi:DNA-binding response OmpR family regulator